MLKRILLVTFFCIFFILCSNREINEDNIIVQGILSKPFSLDPSKICNEVSNNILPQIFETLVTIENKKNNIIPNLAKSWEKSKDGLSYFFHLRPEVKFQDGTYLTAEDVKISFLRQFDSKCPYYYDNSTNIFENLLKGIICSIDIIDSLNIKFNLKYPNSLFLYLLSSPRISSIVSSESLQEYGKNFGKHPIGTGPFELQSSNIEDNIVLVPFREYWNEIPNIKKLKFKVGTRDELETNALKNSIDVLSKISGNEIDKFKDFNRFNFISYEPNNIFFLGFNLKKEIIKNSNFRKAILFSLNRKKIVNTLNRTNAIVANGPLPIGIFDSENLVNQEDYNLEISKKLLQMIGNNIPKLKLIGYLYSPRTLVFFDIIVNHLNQVGIEIEKKYYNEWEDFSNAKKNENYDLILDGWTADILGDSYFFLYNLFCSNSNFNVFQYMNEKIDKLLEDAVRTFDKDKRHKMYEEINNIIIEDIPAVFISQIKDVFVVNKRIKNVIINPYRYIEYDKVIID